MDVICIICYVLLAFLAVFLVLIAPGRKYRGGFNFTKYRYAHRGLHDAAHAENSLSAFSSAVERGFGIELDVRLSKDGEVVVFHDPDLKRVCGVDRKVSDLTAKELSAVRLAGTEEGVPLFTDVLKTVKGKVPILVEIKEDTARDKDVTPAALKILSSYDGPCLVESFNPLSLSKVKAARPDLFRGLLSDHFTLDDKYKTPTHRLLQWFLLNVTARPQFIAYNHEHKTFLPFRLFRFLFRVPTFAWTVRSETDEATCRSFGFDTVIFENYIPKD